MPSGYTDKKIVIAATSDIHGLLEGIEEVCKSRHADILTISGDIEPADIFISKPYWFEKKFFPLIRKLREIGCEVVAIPGNHDFYLSGHYNTIVRGENKSVPPNFHLLIDESVEIYGLQIYGTPWVPTIDGRWCFEGSDNDIGDYFSLIPKGIDVLLSHTPPFIKYKSIDQSLAFAPEHQLCHFGSKTLKDAIVARSPSVVLCGHIHSGDHSHVGLLSYQNKPVHIWNVSRVDEEYKIGYKIKILEITNGTVTEQPFNECFGLVIDKANRGEI